MGLHAIGPCPLDQSPPGQSVAVMPPCRMVAPPECSDGTRPRKPIDWRGVVEAGEVADLSNHRHRNDEGDAAPGLHGLNK